MTTNTASTINCRSADLDEAVERLDGLAQAHHEEALDKYMWAVVEESKSERRVLAFQLLAALYERAFGADTLVSSLDAFFEEDAGSHRAAGPQGCA